MFAQSTLTKHTLQLTENQQSPSASLNEVSWIAGHWQGEAFGGIAEEIWSPPSGGSMMCAFKLTKEDKVQFYEICTITEENGTLMLRLKHFHPDLKGWEEKDETVEFPLVRLTGDRAYFSGFTFERVSENEMNIYVLISGEPGKEEEVKFNYKKKKN
jgi:hypothetical protein